MSKRYRVELRYLCRDVVFVTAKTRGEAADMAEEYVCDPDPPAGVCVTMVGGVVQHYNPVIAVAEGQG